MNADHYIRHLNLQPHPEGGYYKEVYRSAGSLDIPGFPGPRQLCTSIYFLLEKGNFSAFHRIRSDEIWHFYAGDPLEVIEIDPSGKLNITTLGRDAEKGERFQYVVPAGNWFGSRVKSGSTFSLVGCTVSPGFDFSDFEMAQCVSLSKEFPQHQGIIEQLTRC